MVAYRHRSRRHHTTSILVCSAFSLTAQCDVYEFLKVTVHARVFGSFCGIIRPVDNQLTTSEERGAARSKARSCIFLRPIPLHATTPGAQRIVSVLPRSFVSYTS
jgi:hypothetical protein